MRAREAREREGKHTQRENCYFYTVLSRFSGMALSSFLYIVLRRFFCIFSLRLQLLSFSLSLVALGFFFTIVFLCESKSHFSFNVILNCFCLSNGIYSKSFFIPSNRIQIALALLLIENVKFYRKVILAYKEDEPELWSDAEKWQSPNDGSLARWADNNNFFYSFFSLRFHSRN